MSHTIKHVWAARVGRHSDSRLVLFEKEPHLENFSSLDPGGLVTSCKPHLDEEIPCPIIDEKILPMPFIAPGEKKKVTISVTAD